jgi:D-arabinose 1-dehydrogenase-like Zn-dependent alcohol dehydrogenase
MKSTYKAVEVSAPGNLRVGERSIPEPGAAQVRIRVEACVICHTDAATVTGIYPGLELPRVAGREVVGRHTQATKICRKLRDKSLCSVPMRDSPRLLTK